MVYTIYEQPVLENPVLENPTSADPVLENPTSDFPSSGNPTQLNKDIQTTYLPKTEKINTDDSRIETEARRIVDKLKDLSAPNSPNKTHFMVEISPHFDALASTKDNDRLFAMLPYKSLCFTSIKDRHGVYAMINKDERRDVSIRKPRPSIRKQLADSKQATSPKKAAARTKKNELEV